MFNLHVQPSTHCALFMPCTPRFLPRPLILSQDPPLDPANDLIIGFASGAVSEHDVQCAQQSNRCIEIIVAPRRRPKPVADRTTQIRIENDASSIRPRQQCRPRCCSHCLPAFASPECNSQMMVAFTGICLSDDQSFRSDQVVQVPIEGPEPGESRIIGSERAIR